MTCKFISFVFLTFLGSITLSAQTTVRHTISGFVRETVSGESLIGVNIYLPDYKTGTVTNNYGFYSIPCGLGIFAAYSVDSMIFRLK